MSGDKIGFQYSLEGAADEIMALKHDIERHIKIAAELVTENGQLRKTLEFYRNSNNWKSPSNGFALQYDPEPSPIQKDRGQKARSVLIATPLTS